MNILFIGDSLISGSIGMNWVAMLARKYPTWVIDNEGKNGDTITRVLDRLERKLQLKSNYDFVVLGAGSNDILIPSFAHRGFLYRQAYKQLLAKGYAPLERPQDFEYALFRAISLVQQHTKARIVLLTLGCLNEDLRQPLNTWRSLFNEIIRDLAWDRNCRLADVAEYFETFLKNKPLTNYLLENFLNTAWFDRWQCNCPEQADKLSLERRLHLTIDGVHLNSKGAKIYLMEIEKQILRLI